MQSVINLYLTRVLPTEINDFFYKGDLGHRFTITPVGNLESPVNLICMSLDRGRKPEYPGKTHASRRGTCTLHGESPPPAA